LTDIYINYTVNGFKIKVVTLVVTSCKFLMTYIY